MYKREYMPEKVEKEKKIMQFVAAIKQPTKKKKENNAVVLHRNRFARKRGNEKR